MSKSIGILDKDYAQWVEDLSGRYRQYFAIFPQDVDNWNKCFSIPWGIIVA